MLAFHRYPRTDLAVPRRGLLRGLHHLYLGCVRSSGAEKRSCHRYIHPDKESWKRILGPQNGSSSIYPTKSWLSLLQYVAWPQVALGCSRSLQDLTVPGRDHWARIQPSWRQAV